MGFIYAIKYKLSRTSAENKFSQHPAYRLRHDGWMMDDLGVIIQAGWMIYMATWMMAVDDEKKKKR